MYALSKEEYMKKLKQSLSRTYDIKTSAYDGSEMRSRIVKCELTSLEKELVWYSYNQSFRKR